MLSLLMLMASMGALGFALIGGAKLVLDILGAGLESSLPTLPPKAMVVGLAYAVGWITAMIAIRVYGNLVLPFIIGFLIWGCLIGVCALYVLILQRMYDQTYNLLRFWAYLVLVTAGLGAMVGLHLIVEDHDLRPLSIPLLVISMIHLGLIVFLYSGKPGLLMDRPVILHCHGKFWVSHAGAYGPALPSADSTHELF
jgi:hypothetical protein